MRTNESGSLSSEMVSSDTKGNDLRQNETRVTKKP